MPFTFYLEVVALRVNRVVALRHKILLSGVFTRKVVRQLVKVVVSSLVGGLGSAKKINKFRRMDVVR